MKHTCPGCGAVIDCESGAAEFNPESGEPREQPAPPSPAAAPERRRNRFFKGE